MAKLIEQIIGHQEILNNLITAAQNDRLAQTYLFVGPSGIGKKLIAKAVAQTLICENENKPCGFCSQCLKVVNNHHENILLIEPDGQQIKVEQAREIREFLNLASWRGKRVIIIDQAQSLNAQSANSLLKILEEPPEGTYFFLISQSSAGILPTIRSRASVISFHPLANADLAKKNHAPDWMIKASRGSFEKLENLQNTDEQELRFDAVQLLNNFINNKNFLLANDWREQLKERVKAQRIAQYWIHFLRDAIYLQIGQKQQVLNSDQMELIQNLAKLNSNLIYFLVEQCLQLLSESQINRDWTLAIEDLWVRGQNVAVD